ncbi:MAG: hydrogenobyrinic acid a,c-diamide synthase (glutamine-hydrolyzing) [Gammaproteobacteria bacterium]|nr:hydrogenobyrinic acid a,c-diamide synthase (glutamine-hydrolyzing) [Gammaproteobacteria bacterium]
MSHFFISAAHKSSGKTTLSLGLCAALKSRNLKVRPFKKGPDYIDPMWLSRAAGADCHNLDFNTMHDEEIRRTFHHYSAGFDISLIEGNKGLYDGLNLDGSNSNAALAMLLNAPVILVIDARGMTRGIAPLILGYQAFEPGLNIAGVILNQLGGSRHEAKLRAVIAHYTDVPVIGAVHHDQDLTITERHLGLIPSNEMNEAQKRIELLGQRIAQQVDLDALLAIAHTAKFSFDPVSTEQPSSFRLPAPCRIGVARDAAFGFYYPGDMEAFQQAGAELVYFDTLHDKELPRVDGLFIGGGFPETQMSALESNRSMRQSVRNAVESGMPIYAECGGLMYLTRSLSWNREHCEMAGAIPADTVMHEKPQGRGYVKLQETANHPWPMVKNTGQTPEIAAHEFHYSSLENIKGVKFAYDVLRGTGIDGNHDGIVYKNVLGCYVHLRDVDENHWVQRFLRFVQQHRSAKPTAPQ